MANNSSQVKQLKSLQEIVSVISQEKANFTTNPVQLTAIYNHHREFNSAHGLIHNHYIYNDATWNFLEVTVCDNRKYNNYTWARRTRFTPVSRNDGSWDNPLNALGNPDPNILKTMDREILAAQGTAQVAFFANVNVTAQLAAHFPQAIPIDYKVFHQLQILLVK